MESWSHEIWSHGVMREENIGVLGISNTSTLYDSMTLFIRYMELLSFLSEG